MVVFFIDVNWFNFDGYIAKKNAERYNQTGKIDIEYLIMLSEEAYNEVFDLLLTNGEYYDEYILELKKDYEIIGEQNWQSYNYTRSKALKAFEKKVR